MFTYILVFVAGIWASKYFKVNPSTNHTTPIEKLKNALLTLALTKVRDEDFDESFEYAKYTGNKLPPLSGINAPNSFFTYIINKEEFKNDMFYSKPMEEKIIAIEKYLEKNLGTDEQVTEFFDSYMELAATRSTT
jgi:hypothetical protein